MKIRRRDNLTSENSPKHKGCDILALKHKSPIHKTSFEHNDYPKSKHKHKCLDKHLKTKE